MRRPGRGRQQGFDHPSCVNENVSVRWRPPEHSAASEESTAPDNIRKEALDSERRCPVEPPHQDPRQVQWLHREVE
jgi:hypothetical protein